MNKRNRLYTHKEVLELLEDKELKFSDLKAGGFITSFIVDGKKYHKICKKFIKKLYM